MILKYGLPLLALAGFAFAVRTVAQGSKPVPAAPPAAEPARSPFSGGIAGAGIVEARTQNIAIGTAVAGLVAEVPVRVGDRVEAGAALLRIEGRDREAELAVREAALAAAESDLQRLVALPRPEDLPPAEARVAEAESALADARQQLDLAEGLADKRALAVQEWDRRRFAVRTAEARLDAAQAELARLRAGAWEPDLAAARARVAAARAQVEAARVEIERLVVRAPSAGTVLQVNARAGEFAAAGVQAAPLMLFGDVSTLHVRVDVDESDAWRLRPGARARAFVRGNRDLSTPLEFVRIDPYVVPKRSLTGESTERVDTRVLQVLYAFDPSGLRVFVGQQMDAFIEVLPEGRDDGADGPR